MKCQILIVDIAVVIRFFMTQNCQIPNWEPFETESLTTPSILLNQTFWIKERLYLIPVKNLLQAEFLQVSSMLLLQLKVTIRSGAHDVAERESGLPYRFIS